MIFMFILTGWVVCVCVCVRVRVCVCVSASVHLAKQCQRRRLKCEKLAYDGRQAMSVANIAFVDYP
jgi:hypothetical protein